MISLAITIPSLVSLYLVYGPFSFTIIPCFSSCFKFCERDTELQLVICFSLLKRSGMLYKLTIISTFHFPFILLAPRLVTTTQDIFDEILKHRLG